MEGILAPGSLDLMIQNLREQDTGVYNCSATYAGNQQLKAGVLVEAFMDIDFGDTPTHQTPLLGTEAKIRCTPVAKPAPQVDWLKDLVPLTNDENHVIQQDGILIKKVTEADEGVYKCRARVPSLGSIDFKYIQVEVYVPPKINIVPEDAKGVELDSVTFNCGAVGKPAPKYSWVNRDGEVLDNKEGYYVDKDNGILTIVSLKPEHTGNYRCTAENDAGQDFAEADLLVLTKPKVEQYLNITNSVDDEAEMRCVATGDPMPEIIFQKETNVEPFYNGINHDDRIEVQQTTDDQGRRVGIMRIRGVMRSDDGLYTCTANSEGGVTQAWGHITVEYKPTFENQHISEVWSWEQEPVNLTCLATSIPNATFQWYFRNVEIKSQDTNFEVLERGPLGVLKVRPSQPYYGTYTCQATNKLGSERYDLQLKEAHVPGPVSSVKVEKKTATTITWGIVDPLDNGGLPIQSFIVQWRVRDMNWVDAQSKQWTKGSSYTLDGLTLQEHYIFRFAAKNEAGIGEWGGEKAEEMPKRAAPEEPLIFNADSPVVELPYTNKYTLQWQVPLDNGEPIDFFQIMYYQVRNTSGKWESTGKKGTEESKYPSASSYTIDNLRPGTHYKIELRAHNEIGYSTPAEAIIKTAE
ncbi:Ncam2p, partial [Halocaridina rubra]